MPHLELGRATAAIAFVLIAVLLVWRRARDRH
jgi:hypothetical protein